MEYRMVKEGITKIITDEKYIAILEKDGYKLEKPEVKEKFYGKTEKLVD